MNNCLLCECCDSEYTCERRELDNDNRFPYKNTSCKFFRLDTSLTSLIVKNVPIQLMQTIEDKIIND